MFILLGIEQYSYSWGFNTGKAAPKKTITIEQNHNTTSVSQKQSPLAAQPKHEIIDAINHHKQAVNQPSAKNLSRKELAEFDYIEPSKEIIDFAPETSTKTPRLTDQQALDAINKLKIPTEQETTLDLQSIRQQENFLNTSPSMQKQILQASRAEQQKLLSRTPSSEQSWSSWFTPKQKNKLEKNFNAKENSDLSSIETSSVASSLSSESFDTGFIDRSSPETVNGVMLNAELQQSPMTTPRAQSPWTASDSWISRSSKKPNTIDTGKGSLQQLEQIQAKKNQDLLDYQEWKATQRSRRSSSSSSSNTTQTSKLSLAQQQAQQTKLEAKNEVAQRTAERLQKQQEKIDEQLAVIKAEENAQRLQNAQENAQRGKELTKELNATRRQRISDRQAAQSQTSWMNNFWSQPAAA